MKIKVNKRTFIIVAAVFLSAFLWQLFFSQGISFFWEDFDIFHLQRSNDGLYKIIREKYNGMAGEPSLFTALSGIVKGYFVNFFSSQQLFQVGFESYSFQDRPYQFLTWHSLRIFLGNKVILYRIFKAMLVAVNACLLFLIVNKSSGKLAILGALLYITSAEVWVSALYLSHLGLIAQCAVIISIFLFLKILGNNPAEKRKNYMLFVLILAFSNYAVLTTGDGRYLALIFLLTLLIFRFKDLPKYLAPLGVLLLLELPIIGILRKLFLDRTFSPINMSSHAAHKSVLSSFFMALRHKHFPINALGAYLLIALGLMVIVHIATKFVQSSRKEVTKGSLINERIIIFMLWFCAAFYMSARVRGFRYGVSLFSFQIYDMAYFIAPFILFSCCYYFFIKTKLKGLLSSIFASFCAVLIILQLGTNLTRLRQFREKAGEMFCSWQNAQEYIEKDSANALVLAFTQFHYKPFQFRDKESIIINTSDSCGESEFCDLEFLEAKLNTGNQDIYVLSKNDLKFRGKASKISSPQKITFNAQCSDLFDSCQALFKKESKDGLNMYYFKKL